ncbi:MAG TPA: hypothetical protein PLJ47_01940 [Candidatus Hydrogenedentes bacterium]|nr:hypothetical protein [Candidatus Hydrogenedentota bacterium]HRK33327.1 hypothetical protein [Candidatus Hydrogenedentota bacterium]
MPVSTSVHISHCLKYIINLRPKSILDIGCGFGMWGFLTRMYLDISEERVQPETWQLRVDGLELFEPYILSHQRSLYSNIFIGDVRELAPKVDNYELIIAGDVIEHLDKADGETVIEQLYEKATRALLVNIPLGEGWEHPERHGNPGELHRSQWYIEDFHPYPNIAETFTLPAGAYGSFYCPKGCPSEDRAIGLMSLADRRRNEDRPDRALHYAQKAHALVPENRDAALFLVDLLLQQSKMNEAATTLQNAIHRDPTFHYAYIALAKILRAMNRSPEATEIAKQLLTQPAIPPDLRAQAESLANA